MDLSRDTNVEIARRQKDIGRHLGLNDEHLVFNYHERDGKVQLDLVTINPKHDQSFLLNSLTGVDKLDALMKMRDYVMSSYENENSYTVQWMRIGENNLFTSYFRANNMYEVLDKFFYGRDQTQHRIFSIVLSPLS
jgi:predicted ATP-grasp superfamily ATP-dependent carboligase